MSRPKRLYLAYRHPSLDASTFIARWRAHGALAMSFMARQQWRNVSRYVHCDAVRDVGLPGIARDVDGVGMITFVDRDARGRHVGFAEARAALEVDEDRVFAARVNRSGLVAEEQVLVDRGPASVALFRVIERRDGLTDEALRQHWRERVPSLVAACGSALRRYVQDWPLPPEKGARWGLDCDLVDELWFEDDASLRDAWSRADARLALRDDPLGAARLLVAAREVVLYPAPPTAAD